jgi:hypothetical protein
MEQLNSGEKVRSLWPWGLETESARDRYITALFRCGLAMAIFFGFLLTPLVSLAEPIELLVASLVGATSLQVTALYAPFTPPKWVPLAVVGGFLGIALPLCGVAVLVLSRVETNDRRCRIIETEMMRGMPRRTDLPEMFQAFGCRPQTDMMPRRPAVSSAVPRTVA